MEDNEDGTYDVSYVPVVVGPHKISIYVKSQSITNSPFTANVEKFVEPSKCIAEGMVLLDMNISDTIRMLTG